MKLSLPCRYGRNAGLGNSISRLGDDTLKLERVLEVNDDFTIPDWWFACEIRSQKWRQITLFVSRPQ